MSKIVLDTNAYIALLAGDQNIVTIMNQATVIYFPVVVLGELFYGFKGGARSKENYQILERFLAKPTVQIADITIETSEAFAHLKHQLKQIGQPIPINDCWIAAVTFEKGAVLVSFDNHFDKVPGIRLWER